MKIDRNRNSQGSRDESSISDTSLWSAIMAGDPDAWSKLVKRYQALVYAVATRAGLSYADASDCFQQTWVHLHRNRKSITDPNRLSAWLTTTARREALRCKRRSTREVSLDSISDPADLQDLPDDALVRIERQAHIEIAIAVLDKRCRRLMDLFFFGDQKLSYEQIALEVGISSNALGPARRRCLDRLKKILTEYGYLDARNVSDDAL